MEIGENTLLVTRLRSGSAWGEGCVQRPADGEGLVWQSKTAGSSLGVLLRLELGDGHSGQIYSFFFFGF